MIWLWIGFLLFIALLLALDLGVFNREAHVMKAREALGWTGVWVTVALLFDGLVYLLYRHDLLGIASRHASGVTGPDAAWDAAVLFLTAYLVEESLSLDNVFVIALIFTHFKVPEQYRHRVLFWGIVGAIVMRGVMIIAGIVLVRKLTWIMYVFGALLLFTAFKLLVSREQEKSPEENLIVRLAQRVMPITHEYDGARFFTVRDGRRVGTLMFLVLLIVETTDLLFAVDSIPAVIGVTTDPFLVFTSNIFAILGLRSLFFALAIVLDKFRYLKPSLVFVLAFIGLKMIAHDHVHLPALASLGIIVGILGIGVMASVISSDKDEPPETQGAP